MATVGRAVAAGRGAGAVVAVRFAVYLLLAAWLPAASARVLNLRFGDTDATADQVAGVIKFEQHAAGIAAVASYVAYLATDCAGTGQTQVGEVLSGAYTSEIELFGVDSTGFTHLVVYLKAHNTGTESDAACICLLDNPGMTVYFTTVGYTMASQAKAALAGTSSCGAQEPSIVIEMVATAVMSSGAVVETDFDTADEYSETAVFSVSFATSTAIATLETLTSAYTVSAPLPAVFTGTGSDATYELATLRAFSTMDDFVPTMIDLDIGKSIAKACVEFALAHGAMVNKQGYVRIQSTASAQSAITSMAQVWQPLSTPTFGSLGASSSVLTAIAASATATSAVCSQVSLSAEDPSCLGYGTI